jgi:hypothetical protein
VPLRQEQGLVGFLKPPKTAATSMDFFRRPFSFVRRYLLTLVLGDYKTPAWAVAWRWSVIETKITA